MKPEKKDYPAYFESYINLVEEVDVIAALKANHQTTLDFIEEVPRLKWNYFYDDGKWTVKQVINHIIDTERIFAYRALRFARGDNQQPLSFDENAFAANANLTNTTSQILADEFDSVRLSNILLFKQLSNKELLLKGKTTIGNANVLSLGFMLCGHAQHHINVIKEKYL